MRVPPDANRFSDSNTSGTPRNAGHHLANREPVLGLANVVRLLSWVRSELPSTNGVVSRVLGTGALVLSLVLTVAPGVVPPNAADSLMAPIAGVGPVSSFGTLIGLGGVALAVRRRFSTSEPIERGVEVSLPDYTRDRSDGPVETVGAGVDGALDALQESSAAPSDVSFVQTKASIKGPLRETAIDVLVETRGLDRDEAEHLLATGQWTTDPRAAALLGKADVALPLRIRVRDWVRGVPLRRQVEATVEEILAFHESGTTDRSPDDRDRIESVAAVGDTDDSPETVCLNRTRDASGFAAGERPEPDLAAEIRAIETALNDESDSNGGPEREPSNTPEEPLALAGREDEP